MNPENPSRQEIEAKVTALLLGELPEDEARVLRFAIDNDAGLKQLHDRLKVAVGLVREVEAKPAETAPLKLSAERRQKLMAHFKTPRAKESIWVKQIRIPTLIEVLAVVAVIAVLAAMMLPALSSAKRKAQRLAVVNELQSRGTYGAAESDSEPSPAAPVGAPPPATGGGPVVAENPGTVSVNPGTSQIILPLASTAIPATEQPKLVSPSQITIALPPASLPADNSDLAASDRAKEVVTDKANAETLVQDGKVLYEMGKLDESQQKLQQAVKLDPDNSGALYYMELNQQAKFQREAEQHALDTQTRMAKVEKQWVAPSGANSSPTLMPAAPPPSAAKADSFAAGNASTSQTPSYDTPMAAPASPNSMATTTVTLDAENRGSFALSDEETKDQFQSYGGETSMAGIDHTRARALKSISTETSQSTAAEAPAAGLPAETPTSTWSARDLHQKNDNIGTSSGNLGYQWYLGQSINGQGGTAPGVGGSAGGAGGGGGTGGGGGGFGGRMASGSGGGGNGVSAVNPLNRGYSQSANLGMASDLDGQNRTVNIGMNAASAPALPKVDQIDPNTGLPYTSETKSAVVNPNASYSGLAPSGSPAVLIDPNTGLPFASEASKSVNFFAANNQAVPPAINPATGLPMPPETDQFATANPMGQFPSGTGTFALDGTKQSATKTPADRRAAGVAGSENFYRNITVDTNAVVILGDIPVTGHLFSQKGTTLAQRPNDALKNRTDAAGEGGFKAGSTREEINGLRYLIDSNGIPSTPELAMNEHMVVASEATLLGEKKAELAQLEDTHKLLYSKMKSESVGAAIPHSTMVEVVDTAEPQTNQSLWQKFTGQYASTARIQVQNDGGIIPGMNAPAAGTFSYDPYFTQTTFEVIQSQLVLSNAITRLDLNDAWGKKYNDGQPLTMAQTMEMLKGHLSLSPVKNTKLINVTVTESDPKEAAAIANAVVQSYQAYRAEQTTRITEAGFDALKESYLEESNRMQQLQQEIDRLSPTKPKESDAPPPKAAPNIPVPQPEIQVKENAFSTFSMNVSDASFQLAAASLEKGRLPDAVSVRSEEFINAFDYRDPEPSGGERIAFTWERSRDPFAHNRDFLRFSLKAAATGRQPGRPLNLVLLLDDSGSMERADRVAIIREALRILATQLQPEDTLSIVNFARTAHLWADGISGDKAGAVLDQVGGLTPEGGTNLEEAMRLAYETARRHYLANGMNRVVLITDGAANLGDVDAKDLKARVDANRKQGIALDCFGIGWEDYNDNLLEQLSSQGDGRYAFLNKPEDARNNFGTKLAGALQIAASGLKVQVEFNPRRTISYRQIGYATHQLTKQQFRDNTVAAGELAAAESGNALYTVETNPEGDGPIATVHVRYQIPGTTDYREQSWDVPYNGHAGSLEKSSPAMRLATTAATFSEWLASSPYAAEVNPDDLLNDLNGVTAVYGPDTRPRKLEWMIRQAKSIAGK